MTESPQFVVRRSFAIWEEWPQLDRILNCSAADVVYIDGPRGIHRGIDALTEELEVQAAMGWRNLSTDVKSLVANGGTVMTEHVDSFNVGAKPFSMDVMSAFEINADGRIRLGRDYYRFQDGDRPAGGRRVSGARLNRCRYPLSRTSGTPSRAAV